MNDYLTFRKMITPVVIQVVFWLGALAFVIGGIGTMFAGPYGGFWKGLIVLVFGTLFWRIWCELVIVFFSMNDSLKQIRESSTTS
jgi:hypothetical protein